MSPPDEVTRIKTVAGCRTPGWWRPLGSIRGRCESRLPLFRTGSSACNDPAVRMRDGEGPGSWKTPVRERGCVSGDPASLGPLPWQRPYTTLPIATASGERID